MSSEVSDSSERYARQRILPWIGEIGQQRLAESRVAILGVGALGTHAADTLARAGVGFIRLVDRDVPDITNLQRQILFTVDDVTNGIPKSVAAARAIERINPDIKVEPVVTDINATVIEKLIHDVNLVVDGSDNFELRYILNDAAVKLGKPWVYGGVISTHGMSMTFRPGSSPCLRCVFPESPQAGDAPTCDTAGVLAPAVSIIAAIQATEAIKLLTGNVEHSNRALVMVDVWALTFQSVMLKDPDPGCPACGRREFEFLDRSVPRQTTELCGSDSIQIMVHPPPRLLLGDLATRLSQVGKVAHNEYLLRFQTNGYQLTVFPDGRAIVKGTIDPAEARSIYARYVGM